VDAESPPARHRCSYNTSRFSNGRIKSEVHKNCNARLPCFQGNCLYIICLRLKFALDITLKLQERAVTITAYLMYGFKIMSTATIDNENERQILLKSIFVKFAYLID